jgi:hypothetical protein
VADEQQIPGLSAQRPSFSAWIGVVLLFLVFGLFVLVAFGAAPRGSDYEKKRAAARLEKLKTAHAETTKALTTYAWVDKSKGVARIPINDAIHSTLMELAQKQPAPANPITPEAEPGAAQNTAPVTAPPGGPPPAAGPSATPVSKGGHESETGNQHAATVNPAPVAPGTQPGPSSTPAAPPPPQSGQPNLAGSPPPQTPPTPHGSPLPVRGKTPSP